MSQPLCIDARPWVWLAPLWACPDSVDILFSLSSTSHAPVTLPPIAAVAVGAADCARNDRLGGQEETLRPQRVGPADFEGGRLREGRGSREQGGEEVGSAVRV